jgi:hypothetical protein
MLKLSIKIITFTGRQRETILPTKRFVQVWDFKYRSSHSRDAPNTFCWAVNEIFYPKNLIWSIQAKSILVSISIIFIFEKKTRLVWEVICLFIDAFWVAYLLSLQIFKRINRSFFSQSKPLLLLYKPLLPLQSNREAIYPLTI